MNREEMRIQFALIKELEKSKSELVNFYGLPQIKRELRKQIKASPWLEVEDFIYKKMFFNNMKEVVEYTSKITIENSDIYKEEIKCFQVGEKYILFHITKMFFV